MDDLYRLIYTSRNLVGGPPEDRRREGERILAVSRRNNRRDGITGALLFAAGAFAQILEGPRAAVEATFERIQCDARHGNIDVLQCEGVAARAFADFDMAFVGRPCLDGYPEGEGGRGTMDVARLGPEGLCAAVLALVQAQEKGAADAAAGPAADPASGSAALRSFDEGRLRAELAARRPTAVEAGAAPSAAPSADPSATPSALSRDDGAAPPAASADPGDAVLRAALDQERARTTELRRDLDTARVALARAAADGEVLVRHRDIWADRAAQLRTALRTHRDALATAEAERDALGRRLSAHDAELDRLRVHRDIWAERARALAAALCRDPVEPERDGDAAVDAHAEPGPTVRALFPLRNVLP